jgi:hypothetical protein
VTTNAVFSVVDFGGGGLPGIAMIVQSGPGGEISLPNPLPAPAPDFLISVGMPTVVAPGGQTELIVTVKKIAGFSEAVTLSCGELPAGVSCDYPSAVINGGSGQTTVTVAAASSAPTGTYAVTFTGTATGEANGLSHGVQRAITIASSTGATNADLRPLAINFAAQIAGTSGPSQTAYLTNAGSATLQISSVSITGPNAADFAITSNSCGTSLTAYANCPITVAFSPTAAGGRSATLVASDNATGGLQTVSLSGNGLDFGVGAPAGGGTATVAAGKEATYALSVAGSVGFSGSVSLSCSGAPTAATCAVSPATVVLSSGSSTTATVTVTTTARSGVTTLPSNRENRWTPWSYFVPGFIGIFAIGFGLLVGFVAILEGRSRRRMVWAPLAAGVLLLAGVTMSGCGGGGSAGGGTNPPPTGGTATGTPAGTYTITVTATSGSGANVVTRKTNLMLVVQ